MTEMRAQVRTLVTRPIFTLAARSRLLGIRSLRRATPYDRDLAFRGRTMSCPLHHQSLTLLKEIAAPVCSFNLVADGTAQCHLGNLSRIFRLFGGPIAERRAKTVWSDISAAHPLQKCQECHIRERSSCSGARKDEVV